MNENGNTAYDIVNRKMSLPQVDSALQLFDRAELSFWLCHRGCSWGADVMIKHYYSDNRNMLFLYCLYYSDKKV